MAESEYCDDYYEYMNDDCDGDCDNCNHKECDEHPLVANGGMQNIRRVKNEYKTDTQTCR